MKIIIIALSILLILSVTILFLLKIQIKNIIKQLKLTDGTRDDRYISISLMDKDLTNLTSEINQLIIKQKENSLNIVKRENNLKKDIANISHDLRTPLTSIIGYLQLLKNAKLNKEYLEYVNIILNKAGILKKLINDFFELSYKEPSQNPPNFNKINLYDFITEIILEYTIDFEERSLEPILNFPKFPIFIMADTIILNRIFQNLITNALKYGKNNLIISIEDKDKVIIKFKNYIINSDEIEIEKVFERFYSHDKSRNNPISGLGLSIVKILVEKMNGKVYAAFEDDYFTIVISFPKII